MIEKREFTQLGQPKTQWDWLETRYHFSFANYHDPDRMGWGAIRVWNDDIIAPKSGFGMHPHDNMEIITYVMEGAITHQDSMGNTGITHAGDVQVMSAGTGILHAEMNAGDTPTHLFQIWIIPEKRNTKPYWDTRPFPKMDRAGQFVVLASGFDADENALPIGQQARVLGATLQPKQTATAQLGTDRYGYLVVAAGDITINDELYTKGDAAAIHNEASITVTAKTNAEVIMVDAPDITIT